MLNKTQKLLYFKERPQLCAADCNEYVFIRRKNYRLLRLLYAFISTLILIGIFCGIILFYFRSDIYSFFEDISLSFTGDILNSDSPHNTNVSKPVNGILLPSMGAMTDNSGKNDSETDNTVVDPNTLYDFDYTAVPYGEIPIIPMDLSLTEYGDTYIHNSTGYTPNTEELLNNQLQTRPMIEYLSSTAAPTVLIIHTHGTEAYSKDGAISYPDNGEELARSADTNNNVVAVGKVLANALKKEGINAIHCEIMHDENEYRNSYSRAEETIQKYLEQYPTISLIIDLHRDAVVKSNGELVRPITAVNGEAVAQVMCVVGSDWGGEDNPNWEGNLALALKLRKELNEADENVCRPVYLKSSTYNQEFSRYSLLLEIGSAGNSLEEACRAAELVAKAIAKLK